MSSGLPASPCIAWSLPPLQKLPHGATAIAAKLLHSRDPPSRPLTWPLPLELSRRIYEGRQVGRAATPCASPTHHIGVPVSG